MLEVILGLSPILLIILIFLFYLNLHKALSGSPLEYRPINPWLVWLGLLPFVGIVWTIVLSVLISLNIRRRCLHHNIRCYGTIVVPLGLVASLFAGSATLPLVGPSIALFSAPLWILYLIVVAFYTKLLNTRLKRRHGKADIVSSP